MHARIRERSCSGSGKHVTGADADTLLSRRGTHARLWRDPMGIWRRMNYEGCVRPTARGSELVSSSNFKF
ncbi:hypothetical protein TIFTF001_027892 [Ficus carica]|uniref:Uncharacterized protein n=1 Tax=Ficus carica TaxID=3494 RepID=A0AA88IVQ8_FICCA|nr:hypothetical protein TIFTF001_027892 [Ficus carica]